LSSAHGSSACPDRSAPPYPDNSPRAQERREERLKQSEVLSLRAVLGWVEVQDLLRRKIAAAAMPRKGGGCSVNLSSSELYERIATNSVGSSISGAANECVFLKQPTPSQLVAPGRPSKTAVEKIKIWSIKSRIWGWFVAKPKGSNQPRTGKTKRSLTRESQNHQSQRSQDLHLARATRKVRR